MKYLPLFFVMATMAVGQDTTVPSSKNPPTGANSDKPAERPDLKPAKPEPGVPPSDLRPAPPELPPLPQSTKKTDKSTDAAKKENEASALVPEKVPHNKKGEKGASAIGTTAERPRTRTALLPPMTQLDLDLRVRYRQAHTRASSDPAVRALWEQSRLAHTDFEKREAMKSYYELIYKKMLSYDKGIEPIVTDRKSYNIRRLVQTRVSPTEGLPEVDGVDNRGGGGLPYSDR
jgi:hypothetical protein